MQKIGVYLILVVTGALIGASIVSYVTITQNPARTEQIKVTIQGIDYRVSDSVLEIALLNDAPEKNLEGKVIVSQAENQWTSDVNWYYTGYGEAEILCDSINGTQNFNIKYVENNPKATYLDRIIEWKEVAGQHFTFMETEELRITSVTFTNSTSLTVNVINTGTTDVTITSVTVSGSKVTGATTPSNTVATGNSGSCAVTITGELVSGCAYNIELLSSKGNKFSYVSTVTFQGSTTTQAGAVLKVDNVRFYNDGANIEIILRNSGTDDAQVSTVYVGTTASNLATQTGVTYNPSSKIVTAGSTLTITITYAWTDGTRYYFKMTTEEGYEIPFSREA